MILMSVEHLLDTIDHLAEEDRVDEIRTVVARARAVLENEHTLVTTTQAARLLGIGSINTVKSMVNHGEITGARKIGNRTMIPMGEIKRLQNTDIVRDLRAIADALSLGALPDGEDEEARMSQEQMDILEAGRPGTLPWKQ